MPTATVRVIKGAPEETELAALVAALHVLSRPAPARTPELITRPRRAPWTRPRRRSGLAWAAALDN
ncbi:MAG: acyl-CoA carboxylase subunit epsilon [Pseudonocardiaceae bacterium]